MEQDAIGQAALELSLKLARRGMTCATAESCTGGLVSAALTELPGSSAWFMGGVVAYANSVKQGLLGVAGEVLAAHGAVSEQVVLAMAANAAARLGADCALSVSGVAGPTGGTPAKPVGTVWIGWFAGGRAQAQRFLFPGGRAEVRRASVLAALQGLTARLG